MLVNHFPIKCLGPARCRNCFCTHNTIPFQNEWSSLRITALCDACSVWCVTESVWSGTTSWTPTRMAYTIFISHAKGARAQKHIINSWSRWCFNGYSAPAGYAWVLFFFLSRCICPVRALCVVSECLLQIFVKMYFAHKRRAIRSRSQSVRNDNEPCAQIEIYIMELNQHKIVSIYTASGAMWIGFHAFSKHTELCARSSTVREFAGARVSVSVLCWVRAFLMRTGFWRQKNESEKAIIYFLGSICRKLAADTKTEIDERVCMHSRNERNC